LPQTKVDILLRGGSVYDGTGAPPQTADIAISGDAISFVVNGFEGEAGEVLDVDGLAVCPGFIDTHGHSEFTVLADPSALGKVLQGVTTEINGNCGLSAAPLLGEARERREEDLREYSIKERWSSLEEYFSILEDRGPMLNWATLAGHGSVRASVMGYADRNPTPEDMERMKGLLGETLSAGAIGFSTGLIYPPGVYSSREELTELARHGGGHSGGPFIYTSHMRSETDMLLEAIEETIAIGEGAGVAAHISHIKTARRENWHKAEAAISLIEEARKRGMRVTCDRYPYTAASTDLDAVLPAWAFEGGSVAEMKRLQDPALREKIIGELPSDDEVWEGVVVSSVPGESGRWLEGLSIKDIASRMGLGYREALMEVLIKEGIRVGAIFHGMSEENLWKFLSLPYAMVGSDSSSRSFEGITATGKPHPRGFGTFPRFLKNYPGGLAEAIRKVTSLPAETFGIQDRGLIKEGLRADVVVFDPERLADRATYSEPFRRPEGIVHVVINGVPAVSEAEPTGRRPGRVLRNGGA
jgi:N-acyl-D-amino-acid deacylase